MAVRAMTIEQTAESAPAGSAPAGSVPADSVGLGGRLATAIDALASVLAQLEPDCISGPDAVRLYDDLARAERLVTAGKTILAPRIAISGIWSDHGHRSAASLLAELDGGSTGQARRTLETGERLTLLPTTTDLFRKGGLSGAKAAEITQAAILDPDRERELLKGAESEPLHQVKDRCQRSRVTSATRDPMATLRRIHAKRYFSTWTDPDGAFCFQGRDTPERGALLMAQLTPLANKLSEAERSASKESDRVVNGGHGDRAGHTDKVPYGAHLVDAFFLLAGTASSSSDPSASLPGPELLIDRPAPTTVIVRVDLEALRRGQALAGERSEIDGQGPVPVPVVRSLLSDAFVATVFEEAGDIRAVSHLGRTIHRSVRTALIHRDRTCVVPGCGVAYGLEIDHIDPFAFGGPTRLDNLALLCHHHHRLKTYGGWILARTGTTDAEPGWTFEPQPAFGREPDLGLDRQHSPPLEE